MTSLEGARCSVRQLLLGRRFVQTLRRNQEAADRLDLALKDVLRHAQDTVGAARADEGS